MRNGKTVTVTAIALSLGLSHMPPAQSAGGMAKEAAEATSEGSH